MRFFFADDSRQVRPSRPAMGPLLAVGGIDIPDEYVGSAEAALNDLCRSSGFPRHEEFKWSPGRKLWMHDHLVADARREFLLNTISVVREHGCVAIVVVADTKARSATGAATVEQDLIRMLLERVEQRFRNSRSEGIVIVDRPPSDRRHEDKFLLDCVEMLESGTKYVKPERVALNVLSTPSKYCRLLQVADVVTSGTTAMVSGETSYAPPIFAEIKKILRLESGRIGGVGLKIHPDVKYVNLYYWVLGDAFVEMSATRSPLRDIHTTQTRKFPRAGGTSGTALPS